MSRVFKHLGRRRLSRIVILTLCLGVVQSELAPNVFAHHPEVQASVDCEGLISYSASAWVTDDPLRRENHDVRIRLTTNDGSGWSEFTEIGQGQFLPTQTPPFQFSGTHQLTQPFPQRFRVQAIAVVKWGPNQEFSTAPTQRTTEAQTLPECPGQPGAQMAIACDQGGARITFQNSGGGTSTLQLLSGTTLIDTVEVTGAQGSVTKVYPMVEGETKTFTVKSGTTTVASETLTFDCINPAATMNQSCVAGGVQVNLTNTGAQLPVEFTVTKNGSELEKVTVPAGGQQSRTYPMVEDETSTFAVSGGGFSASNPFTFNCVEGNVVTQPPPVQPAQVLGVQIRPPEGQPQAAPQAQVAGEQLPASGVEGEKNMYMVMVALVLVLAGVGLVMTGRLSLDGGR
jgi:hypothetical protein